MNDRLLIAMHGYGTYAITYRHMIEFAKTEAPHVEWAMLLPTSHHLDVVSEVLAKDRILCLEHRQGHAARNKLDAELIGEYSGNIFADIEAEKKVFKHRPAAEQLSHAIEIYCIYKNFLQRLKPTHLLMAHVETFDGKVLVGLARELNIPLLLPTDMRHFGGTFFSRDTDERIPSYRCVTLEGLEWAERTIKAFRIKPGPSHAPHVFMAPDEEMLPLKQKSLIRRGWGFVSRTLRNPQLFEAELFLTNLKYTFPGLVEGFRSLRAARNARIYDSRSLDQLPKRFIYYPLQVTPESSINTPAPYFVDQMRAIDAIRFAMPSNWVLVVKEHTASLGIRPASFYRALRQRAGVHIANATVSSIELIKNAHLTISVTGSATLEALLLGRPALALGGCFFAEYLGGICPISELPSRIAQAASAPCDEGHIRTALAEMHSVRYECVFRPADEIGNFGNRAENMKRMIRSILDHIRRIAENRP